VLAYISGWLILVTIWKWSWFSSQFGDMLRYANTADTYRSGAVRSLLARQAQADFAHNPIVGVGYEVLVEAHSIYLQIIASGGLFLAAGMALFWFGIVRDGWHLRQNPLASALLTSVILWLLAGAVENQLTDRYIYFPVAALATLSVLRRGALIPDEAPEAAPVRIVSSQLS
jgi:hypothetical protein